MCPPDLLAGFLLNWRKWTLLAWAVLFATAICVCVAITAIKLGYPYALAQTAAILLGGSAYAFALHKFGVF